MIKLLRKIRAKMNLTFVADCPVCHKHFYGFEPYKTHMKLNDKHYRIVCHRCSKETREENEELKKS